VSGFVAVIPGIGWSRHVGELRLVVDPEVRRRGIGRNLAGRALRAAIEHGLTKVVVEVIAEQDSTIALFQHLGFRAEALLEDATAALGEDARESVNRRRLTNVGVFRAYVRSYLRAHSKLHDTLTLLVRQLGPGPEGLPIEIYCFTKTTEWVAYEDVQSDIFDHLLAILPEFGLRVFQQPSGADFRELMPAAQAQEAK